MMSIFLFFAEDALNTGINLPHVPASSNSLQTVLQIISGLIGAIALLIIVINALRYVVSQGDSSRTAKAKNAILYALIGLVVSFSAYAIVTFVLFNVT